MADSAKFLPTFTKTPNKPRRADFQYMEFNGHHVDAQGNSVFGFDINPFTNTLYSTTPRNGLDALAPAHTHFEYDRQVGAG